MKAGRELFAEVSYITLAAAAALDCTPAALHIFVRAVIQTGSY